MLFHAMSCLAMQCRVVSLICPHIHSTPTTYHSSASYFDFLCFHHVLSMCLSIYLSISASCEYIPAQFSGRPQFTATRSPDDLIRDVREMPLDDMRVYNTCLLDPFHAKYFVLAHQLGVKGRKGKLTMTKRAR